jgi:hypothetical protein
METKGGTHMKVQTFSALFLTCLFLIPYTFVNADEFYYGHTDGQNLLGADYEKFGANYRAQAQFNFPAPGIDGSIAAAPRGSNQFSLFYPTRIGVTANFSLQRSDISFDDSAHQFTRNGVKNFPLRVTQPHVFDYWQSGSNQGLIFAKNSDLIGRKINMPAANPIGGNIPLLNTSSGTILITACVDPEGTYFAAITFNNQGGYFIILRNLVNGRPTGNAVIYHLTGAVICVDCSKRQTANGRIFIAFKEYRLLGAIPQTRPFIAHFNGNFSILGVKAITNWNSTNSEIAFRESFNTIKFVEKDDRVVLVIYGKRFGNVLAVFWRNINPAGLAFGPPRRLFMSTQNAWGYDPIAQIGHDE